MSANSAEKTERLLQVVELIQNAYREDPFLSEKDVKQKVCEASEELGMSPIEANRNYNAASQVVIPFFNSGREYTKGISQLEHLANIAKDELFQEQYNKEGQPIGS